MKVSFSVACSRVSLPVHGNGLAVALTAMRHVALVARLGAGGCEHAGLGRDHGCHLLTPLAQLVGQGGHVLSNSDGLAAHGAALGVKGVLALNAIIHLEHGEDFDAHLVKVVAPLALMHLAFLVHANSVGQVRGQGVQEGRGQQVVAPV
eukprot:5864989-Pleurochrysis_carterae.AAC.1